MKDGAINIEEDKELSKMLTESMSDDKSYLNESMKEAIKSHNEFMKRKKERAMDLDSHWYATPDSNKFFTAELEQMKDIITDEIKRDKVIQRISEGSKFVTFFIHEMTNQPEYGRNKKSK